MNYNKRIESNYKILLGKPVIKGTRISVELILKKLAEGATIEDLLQDYKHLRREDIYAALQYASAMISNEEILVTQS